MDLPTISAVRRARDRSDLAVLSPGTAVLAGGTWLFSEPQDHLSTLLDVTGLGWEPFTPTADGVSVAATATIAEVAGSDIPLARECARALAASFKIWHAATVGGNVCLALAAGSMISLAVALDGVAVVWGAGHERRVPVHEFVLGVRRTALARGEILRAVELRTGGRTAFRRAALSAEGRSGAVVTGRREGDGIVLGVTAATERPYRFAFGSLPTTRELDDALSTIGSWYDDPHGAPDWRRHVTGLLAREVAEELT